MAYAPARDLRGEAVGAAAAGGVDVNPGDNSSTSSLYGSAEAENDTVLADWLRSVNLGYAVTALTEEMGIEKVGELREWWLTKHEELKQDLTELLEGEGSSRALVEHCLEELKRLLEPRHPPPPTSSDTELRLCLDELAFTEDQRGKVKAAGILTLKHMVDAEKTVKFFGKPKEKFQELTDLVAGLLAEGFPEDRRLPVWKAHIIRKRDLTEETIRCIEGLENTWKDKLRRIRDGIPHDPIPVPIPPVPIPIPPAPRTPHDYPVPEEIKAQLRPCFEELSVDTLDPRLSRPQDDCEFLCNFVRLTDGEGRWERQCRKVEYFGRRYPKAIESGALQSWLVDRCQHADLQPLGEAKVDPREEIVWRLENNQRWEQTSIQVDLDFLSWHAPAWASEIFCKYQEVRTWFHEPEAAFYHRRGKLPLDPEKLQRALRILKELQTARDLAKRDEPGSYKHMKTINDELLPSIVELCPDVPLLWVERASQEGIDWVVSVKSHGDETNAHGGPMGTWFCSCLRSVVCLSLLLRVAWQQCWALVLDALTVHW